MLMKPQANPRWPSRLMRSWPRSSVTRALRPYLFAMCTGWALAVGAGLLQTRFRPTDLMIFVLIVACGAFAVEATRRQGEPAGALNKDLLSAWFLPIAFVLPPVYSLFAPIPLLVLTQYRVRRAPMHRRVLTVAAIGLAHALASIAFHRMSAAWNPEQLRPGLVALLWATIAVVAALLAALVNSVLIAIAVKIDSPDQSWGGLLWDPENLVIDIGELCIGVVVGLLCVLQPLLVLIALSPVVLLQRSLIHDQLWAAARLDPKTGLLNAPTWEREAASEISRAQRTRTALSVMLLDLDHFKAVNDRYGHLAGDDVLNAVADVMRGQLREYDRCARFGGDEFAVLLPQSDLAEATQTAERIRRHVAAIAVPAGGSLVRTSVSIGIAELWSPLQRVTDLLAVADLSLYRAKENRDQVHSAGRDDEPALRHR
jgi:diguanylate cyclase (GGDEF)-like protein